MNEYKVFCNFTTVHSKGRFVGRSAEVCINSKLPIEQLYKDLETIKTICAEYIYSVKPKYKIFMIDITKIITNNG